jgi:alpha-beta hydrolase superfamily lysophospholipase
MVVAGTPDLETSLVRSGLSLHVEHYRPRASARLALVMVHGFSPHCGIYRHVGAALAALGIAVTQFDNRGHGRSGGRRGHVGDFAEYLDDLQEVAAWARNQDPGLPLAMMGHSMGGAIVADFALDDARTEKPHALVLAAPYLKLRMKVPAPMRLAANVAARVLPTLSGPNGLRAEEISRNPEARAGFQQDPLIHHSASAGWFMATLRAQARIRTHADKLRVPTLVLLAGNDRIVANEANLAFAQNAGSIVEVRTYDGLYHELFLEPEADRVLSDIGAWLLSRPQKETA